MCSVPECGWSPPVRMGGPSNLPTTPNQQIVMYQIHMMEHVVEELRGLRTDLAPSSVSEHEHLGPMVFGGPTNVMPVRAQGETIT